MLIRRYKETDAGFVSDLIRTTEKTTNSKDYPPDIIEALCKKTTPSWVSERAGWTHFYVVEEDGKIVGCGAIGPFWDKEDESAIFNVFVLPEYQRKGIGRAILEKLEADEYFLRAKRIEIAASITGVGFYRKFGYVFKNGEEKLDEERLYRLEKFRT